VKYLGGKPRGFPVETALHQQGNLIPPDLFHEESAGSNTRTHRSVRGSRSLHHDPLKPPSHRQRRTLRGVTFLDYHSQQ